MNGHVSAAPETRGRPSIFLHEPAPVGSLTRLACYPWLVVGTTCLEAFAGQVDASIVQLALPTLEHTFDARLNQVTWVPTCAGAQSHAQLPEQPICRLSPSGATGTWRSYANLPLTDSS